MKILRARPTRHFLYLLVRCRCGKRFGHRADRRMIVCYHCGRIADLAAIRRRRPPKPNRSPVTRPSVAAKTRRVASRTAHRRARKSSSPAS